MRKELGKVTGAGTAASPVSYRHNFLAKCGDEFQFQAALVALSSSLP